MEKVFSKIKNKFMEYALFLTLNDYKMLEHKNVIVEQFMNKGKAYEIILEGMKLYQEKKEMLMQPQK